MGDRVGEDVGRKARLAQAQRIAAAAQLQVALGDQEAVVGAAQDVEPLLGGLRQRRIVEQDAGALARAAADSPAQLVQLGQAEAFGLFDDHDGGVGDVDPDLDDGRGDQQADLAVGEVGHDRVLLRAGHLAVHQADAGADPGAQLGGALLGGLEVDQFGFGDQRADPERLGPMGDGVAQTGLDLVQAAGRHRAGGDRGAAGRLLVDARDVEVAVDGELQGARDRGGRHGDQVDGLALGLQPLALGHAEPVLFVDDRQLQVLEADVVLEEGMGADRDLHGAGRQGAQLLGPRRALVAAGQQDGGDPVLGQRAGDGLEMLAGEDLGRGHQRALAAAGGDVGHGQHGDDGLARADVALDQAAHPLAGLEVAANVGQRPLLGAGQAVGQVFAYGFGQRRGGDAGGGLGAALGFALGHGQLVGQQLVIGQAPGVRGLRGEVGLRLRGVQEPQRLAPAREPLAGQPGGVLPLREFGRAAERLQRELAHGAGRQAGGGGIDRLEGRDVGGAVGGDDVVGMGDLQAGAEPLDLAADQPLGAERVLGLELAAEAAEEHQAEHAGAVIGLDPPGLLGAARALVGVDLDLEDLHRAFDRAGDGGVLAADHRVRAQEGDVAHDRPRQLLQQGRNARADALEGRDRCVERKENLGPHGRNIARPWTACGAHDEVRQNPGGKSYA